MTPHIWNLLDSSSTIKKYGCDRCSITVYCLTESPDCHILTLGYSEDCDIEMISSVHEYDF